MNFTEPQTHIIVHLCTDQESLIPPLLVFEATKETAAAAAKFDGICFGADDDEEEYGSWNEYQNIFEESDTAMPALEDGTPRLKRKGEALSPEDLANICTTAHSMGQKIVFVRTAFFL